MEGGEEGGEVGVPERAGGDSGEGGCDGVFEGLESLGDTISIMSVWSLSLWSLSVCITCARITPMCGFCSATVW